MIIYTTKENDMLDWIAWKHYGTTAVLEQIMEENPDAVEERLPGGMKIRLPYIESVNITRDEIRLWN